MKEFIEKLICRLEESVSLPKMKKMELRVGKKQTQGFGFGVRSSVRIVNELAEEFTKTPTPTHPIPIDTQQYIEKLEKRVNNKDWIPCSERLPEKNQRCLVSYKGNINSEGIEEKYVDIDRFEGTRFSFFGIDRVIAWQSLPAPYKEGE